MFRDNYSFSRPENHKSMDPKSSEGLSSYEGSSPQLSEENEKNSVGN